MSTPASPSLVSLSFTLITIRLESIKSIFPPRLALTTVPESIAQVLSIPVPTKAFSGLKHGTACLCILEPIRALLASSCSRKGINEAATDTICDVVTSMY